jgi:ABC-type Fe3+/spermidine/putrescine transport system ATPase subunit
MAFLPPGTALPEARAVGAALRRLAGRGQSEAVGRRMAALGLTVLAGRPAGLLSHGQAALALAAARMGGPGAVLLLDEAGHGLDADAARDLLVLLRAEASSGRLVVMATRSAPLALAADHLVLLGGGRVLQAGAPASLYAEPRDAACARLTGAANILQGTVRELRPGGFVWSAGSRHVQATGPDMRRPVLGSPVTICLRPERLALVDGRQPGGNAVDGAITGLRATGPLLDLAVDTPLGVLRVAVPSWGTSPYPAIGQAIRLGWAVDAATVLE